MCLFFDLDSGNIDWQSLYFLWIFDSQKRTVFSAITADPFR